MRKGEVRRGDFEKHSNLEALQFKEAQAFLWRKSLYLMEYSQRKMETRNLKASEKERWASKFYQAINTASKSLGDYSLKELESTLQSLEKEVSSLEY